MLMNKFFGFANLSYCYSFFDCEQKEELFMNMKILILFKK